jgi:ATP-binding cassette subfamily F protein 3
MIQLLLQPVNLLILDEPTNHLDMQSKDVLKNAIRDFDGTAIIVSHDRAFLDGLVDKVYMFKDQKVFEPIEKSSISLRQEKAAEQAAKKKEANVEAPVTETKQNYEQQKAEAKARAKAEKALKACEEKIEKLETEIAEVESSLAEKNDMQLVERYTQLQQQLDEAMKEWEKLME